jgi:hypothetical protein
MYLQSQISGVLMIVEVRHAHNCSDAIPWNEMNVYIWDDACIYPLNSTHCFFATFSFLCPSPLWVLSPGKQMVCHCAHVFSKTLILDIRVTWFQWHHILWGMPKRINQNPQGRKVKVSIGMLVGNLTANGEQNELHLS